MPSSASGAADGRTPGSVPAAPTRGHQRDASGVVQSFRNFGSALGMAILGTIVLTDAPDQVANGGAAAAKAAGHAAASGFADALQTAFYVGAALMLGAFAIARFLMPAGKQADVE